MAARTRYSVEADEPCPSCGNKHSGGTIVDDATNKELPPSLAIGDAEYWCEYLNEAYRAGLRDAKKNIKKHKYAK